LSDRDRIMPEIKARGLGCARRLPRESMGAGTPLPPRRLDPGARRPLWGDPEAGERRDQAQSFNKHHCPSHGQNYPLWEWTFEQIGLYLPSGWAALGWKGAVGMWGAFVRRFTSLAPKSSHRAWALVSLRQILQSGSSLAAALPNLRLRGRPPFGPSISFGMPEDPAPDSRRGPWVACGPQSERDNGLFFPTDRA